VSRPLILLGVSRSGTTLLRVILDRSPGIAIPDESFFVPLLARRHGLSAERESELVTALHGLAAIVDETLRLDPLTAKLAEQFMDRRHALFLGRGALFPVALEGALKLKEISYIHAEGYPAGEMKHGPIALIDEDLPIVALAADDAVFEKALGNIQEAKARGGRIIVVTSESRAQAFDEILHEGRDTVLAVPDSHPLMSPVVMVIPLQLLAYHVAILRGCDVDQPRNLAKSVTVE
jgi:glucosamine--fructose-6-phosphate aminotransferase (isomerizing)